MLLSTWRQIKYLALGHLVCIAVAIELVFFKIQILLPAFRKEAKINPYLYVLFVGHQLIRS